VLYSRQALKYASLFSSFQAYFQEICLFSEGLGCGVFEGKQSMLAVLFVWLWIVVVGSCFWVDVALALEVDEQDAAGCLVNNFFF